MEQAAYFAVHILSLTETRMASDIFLLRRMEIAELILSGETHRKTASVACKHECKWHPIAMNYIGQK